MRSSFLSWTEIERETGDFQSRKMDTFINSPTNISIAIFGTCNWAIECVILNSSYSGWTDFSLVHRSKWINYLVLFSCFVRVKTQNQRLRSSCLAVACHMAVVLVISLSAVCVQFQLYVNGFERDFGKFSKTKQHYWNFNGFSKTMNCAWHLT